MLHSIMITIKFLCFLDLGGGVNARFQFMSENFLCESTCQFCQVLGIHHSLDAVEQMIPFCMKVFPVQGYRMES